MADNADPFTDKPRPERTSVRLTPLQQHYLKRELLTAELDAELAAMSDVYALRRFGFPFNSAGVDIRGSGNSCPTSPNSLKSPKSPKSEPNSPMKSPTKSPKKSSLGSQFKKLTLRSPQKYRGTEPPPSALNPATSLFLAASSSSEMYYTSPDYPFPLLRFCFDNFVLTFPFIAKSKDSLVFFRKVQQFWEDFANKDISESDDRLEASKRKRMAQKLKRVLLILLSAGFPTTADASIGIEDRETAKLASALDGAEKTGSQTVAEVKLKATSPATLQTLVRNSVWTPQYVNGLHVNVCAVRRRKQAGTDVLLKSITFGLRSKPKHKYQFLVSAQMDGGPQCFVWRTYADFRDLDRSLRREFPGIQGPKLPGNLRGSSTRTDLGKEAGNGLQTADSAHAEPELGSETGYSDGEAESGDSDSETAVPGITVKLPRENQRLALRAYLRNVVAVPQAAQSKLLLEFLFKDKLRDPLSVAELRDMQMRKQADTIRIQNELEFQRITREKAAELAEHMAKFKAEVLGVPNGFRAVFADFKQHSCAADCGPMIRAFLEWGKIQVAATIYQLLVAGDNSEELFSQVRTVHRLMPYALLKNVLKITNPVAMMKGVLDLFLAQPFGGKSLLQTIFSMVLSDDIRAQTAQLRVLESRIALPEVCGALQDGVARVWDGTEAGKARKAKIREFCRVEKCDMVVALLSCDYDGSGRAKTSERSHEITRLFHAWKAEVAESGNGSGNSRDAETYSNIKLYYQLLVRIQDKTVMKTIWNEPLLVSVIKELFVLFYEPLVAVFRAARVYEALDDFQAFMDDLIATVRRVKNDAMYYEANVGRINAELLAVLDRHIDDVVKFIHRVYVNDSTGFFDDLLGWVDVVLRFVRHDGSPALDIEEIVSRGVAQLGAEKQAEILESVDYVIRKCQEKREKYTGNAADRAARKRDGQSLVEQGWADIAAEGILGGSVGAAALGLHTVDMYDLDWVESEAEGPKPGMTKEEAEMEALFSGSLNGADVHKKVVELERKKMLKEIEEEEEGEEREEGAGDPGDSGVSGPRKGKFAENRERIAGCLLHEFNASLSEVLLAQNEELQQYVVGNGWKSGESEDEKRLLELGLTAEAV